MNIFDHAHSKIINIYLSRICTSIQKKQFIPSIPFWDTVSFRVWWPDWPQPFFDHAHAKDFGQLFYLICSFLRYSQLTFVNLYQHAKNFAVWSICSGDMVNLKILESDWPRLFWLISQVQDFYQVKDLRRNTLSEN